MNTEPQLTPIDFPEAAERAFELLDTIEAAKPLQGLSAEHQAWVMVLAVSEFVSRTMGDEHVPPFFRFSADQAEESLRRGRHYERKAA